jgi:hypothetical protein
MITIPDYSRPSDFASFTPDGHRALARHLPGYRHHQEPAWLKRRCRQFDIDSRKPIDCGNGRVFKASKLPARFIGQEFSHYMMSRDSWSRLFDHWGSMTLPDGRIALHSSPYCDSRSQAARMAKDLGLQLLSRPRDMSVYAEGAYWFLWAEPITQGIELRDSTLAAPETVSL